MSNTLRRHRKGPAEVIATFAAIVLGGQVASGCSDANPDAMSTLGGADSAAPTSEPVGPPPGTRLLSEVFSIADATVHDGNWFVLDNLAQQVHRIGPDGELLQSFGREGRGPGEFRRVGAIVAHGDSILVLGDGILHVFSPRGEHIADRRFNLSPTVDCLPATVQGTGAVSAGGRLFLTIECFRPDGGSSVHVAEETADGSLRSLAHRAAEPGEIDWGGILTVVAAHPQGFLFGSAWESCLDLLSPAGRRLDAICHDWLEPVELPPDLAREFEEAIKEVRRQGMRVRLPKGPPAIVGVSAIAGGRLVYQVMAPGDPALETLQLVTRDETGQAVVLPVPSAPVMIQHGSSVLVAWDELDGTRIALRTLDTLGAR